MEQQASFGRKGRLALFVLSSIALLSTAFLLALGFALWWEGLGIHAPHLVLVALVMVLDLCCIGLWDIQGKTRPGGATDTPKSDRRDVWTLFTLASVTAFSMLFALVLVVSILLTIWLVNREARHFCEQTPIGSNISDATARADARKIIWGASGKHYHDAPRGEGSPYAFYFIATFMDKAVCEVSIGRDGKVTSRHIEIQSD